MAAALLTVADVQRPESGRRLRRRLDAVYAAARTTDATALERIMEALGLAPLNGAQVLDRLEDVGDGWGGAA